MISVQNRIVLVIDELSWAIKQEKDRLIVPTVHVREDMFIVIFAFSQTAIPNLNLFQIDKIENKSKAYTICYNDISMPMYKYFA